MKKRKKKLQVGQNSGTCCKFSIVYFHIISELTVFLREKILLSSFPYDTQAKFVFNILHISAILAFPCLKNHLLKSLLHLSIVQSMLFFSPALELLRTATKFKI